MIPSLQSQCRIRTAYPNTECQAVWKAGVRGFDRLREEGGGEREGTTHACLGPATLEFILLCLLQGIADTAFYTCCCMRVEGRKSCFPSVQSAYCNPHSHHQPTPILTTSIPSHPRLSPLTANHGPPSGAAFVASPSPTNPSRPTAPLRLRVARQHLVPFDPSQLHRYSTSFV